MKNLFVVLAIFIFGCFSANFSFAADYSNVTRVSQITAALHKLEVARCYNVLAIINGRNVSGKPIKIMFRNLAVLGYGTCEAITAKTDKGLIIFINSTHKNDSPEAIACLIAHESQHHENTQTFEEELRAWNAEINTWMLMTKYNPSLKDANTPLVKRLNYITKLYKRGNNSMSEIEGILAKNPAYSKLARS